MPGFEIFPQLKLVILLYRIQQRFQNRCNNRSCRDIKFVRKVFESIIRIVVVNKKKIAKVKIASPFPIRKNVPPFSTALENNAPIPTTLNTSPLPRLSVTEAEKASKEGSGWNSHFCGTQAVEKYTSNQAF